MATIKRWFFQLNLFPQPPLDIPNEDASRQKLGFLVTRAYLIILTVILVLLAITFLIPTSIERINIISPTLEQYRNSPSDVICPCTEQILPYNTFLTANVSFHQVCSSQFISDQWISSLYFGPNHTLFDTNDFRRIGFSFFQTLSMLCRISQQHVQDTLSIINSQSFFSANLLSTTVFKAQVLADTTHFRTDTFKSFEIKIEVMNSLISGSFLLNSLYTSIRPFLKWFFRNSATGGTASVSLIEEDGTVCYCTASSSCEAPTMKIFVSNDSQFDIPGFRQRCMPVDTAFHSTLECFYNQTCIDMIVSYLSIGIKPNALNSLASSRFETINKVQDLAFQLMVENWTFTAEYEHYFYGCFPKSCSYLTKTRPAFFHTIGYLIGILSGLCSGLRIVMMIMIRLIQRALIPRSNTKGQARPKEVKRTYKILSSLQNGILRLNFFKTSNVNETDIVIHHQKTVTRLYILLLVIVLIIITFYTTVSKQNFTKTSKNPSEAAYYRLTSLYPYSLHCPCTKTTFDYDSILTIQPIYHPLCNSDFVSSQWIELLRDNYRPSPVGYADFLSIGASMFQSLAVLCQTAIATINTSLETFLRRRLVTAEVLAKDLFDGQFDGAIDQWQTGITNELSQIIDLFRANMQGNQLLSDNYNVKWYVSQNMTYHVYTVYTRNLTDMDPCSCFLSSQCSETLWLFEQKNNATPFDGLMLACTPITALALSDLRLFYDRSFIDWLLGQLINRPSDYSLNLLPQSQNQSDPKETIQSMIDRSFVQKWSVEVSFSNYYQICAPELCTYQTFRRADFTFIAMTIIAVFGGLSTSLKILMQFILLILRKYRVQCSHLGLKTWMKNFVDHQHLTIRLKIVLISLSLAGLYFSYAVRKYDQLIVLAKDPSYELYSNLMVRYPSDSLQCPCSQTSIPYDLFMNITVVNYHQICSQQFLRYDWLSFYLPRTLALVYDINSFNDLIPIYFQIFAEFCDTSRKTIQNQLSMFLTDILIESFPNPSPVKFQLFMEEKIELFKINLARSVLKTLELLREMTHINQLMTILSGNWRFGRSSLSPGLNSSNDSYIPMFPNRYNDCDCGLSKSCMIPMTNDQGVRLAGLMTGCYPLEALLQSTLECFYQRSCFQMIRNVSYQPFVVTRLLLNASSFSRFSINSTVQQILEGLFVEKWSTNISYERYYQACAPSSCSYSTVRSATGLEIVTDLLGLYGGLTIIIEHFIVPLLIRLIFHWIKPMHRIHLTET